MQFKTEENIRNEFREIYYIYKERKDLERMVNSTFLCGSRLRKIVAPNSTTTVSPRIVNFLGYMQVKMYKNTSGVYFINTEVIKKLEYRILQDISKYGGTKNDWIRGHLKTLPRNYEKVFLINKIVTPCLLQLLELTEVNLYIKKEDECLFIQRQYPI